MRPLLSQLVSLLRHFVPRNGTKFMPQIYSKVDDRSFNLDRHLMRPYLKKKTGFSITEVIMAAVVFSVTAVGIISTVSVLKKPAVGWDRKLVGTYYGQQILEDLRAKVDQSNWADASSPLAVGNHTVASYTAGNGTAYDATYTVTELPSGAREVTLTVNWVEP